MKTSGRLAGMGRRVGRWTILGRTSPGASRSAGWSSRVAHPSGRGPAAVVALAILALSVLATLGLSPNRAQGDESKNAVEPLAPTAAQTKEFLESGKAEPLLDEPETDLHAAQTMPHRDLERGEALELAEAVFDPELEDAGGIFDELEPERFVSNYAAVVPVSSLPEEPGQSEEGLAAEHPNRPVLFESMLPLRTENSSGEEEAVDLGLEHAEGELQPANPLAEVGVPEKLGEGISLDGPEVEVTIAGAPEGRAPTNAGGGFAFYPEVAEDTDLIVTPTPRGLETMTDIRGPEAPMQTTYELSLPAGAELRATGEGGAEVVEGERATLLIPAPTATDAAGNPVQTELSVSAGGITVTTDPDPSTAYPILVDPTYIVEGWRWTLNHESMAAWTGTSTNWYAMEPIPYEIWNPDWYPGLDLTSAAWGGSSTVGTQANWEYWVPRYREDLADFGTPPTSWVYLMSSEGVQFHEYGNNANYPALVIGIVDPNKGWQVTGVHYGGQGEMTSWTEPFPFENKTGQTNDKGADMNLVTYEYENPPKRRDTYMADTYIAVVDESPPIVGRLMEPQHWMNTTAEPIEFVFDDEGLGVRSAGISFNGNTEPGWGFDLGCSATTASPCPRVVKSSAGKAGEARTTLAYYPGSLPTGRDPLTVTVGDVFWGIGTAGHTTSAIVEVPVDHTGPEVSLSGPLTEQGSLGTHRPSYALRVNAKDGIQGAPQSGIKKVEVRVDGKKVAMPEEAEWEPRCETQNCPLNGAEWSMSASEYGNGPHEVTVIAEDAVGNVTTKVLQVELHQAPPTLSVSGTLTEQAKLGTEKPSYKLNISASASAESPTPAALPTYSSSFGTTGTGNGQFTRPGDVAVDAQGNIWVVDSNDNRLEKFNEKGEFLSKFGEKGSGAGQFNRPTALAIDAAGNLWVTDSANRRVEEFSATGTYLGKFGEAGTGAGQFAGSGPEGIAIDAHGNIWVSDTYGGRLEKFNEKGAFIRSVGSPGNGLGRLGRPEGIAIAPGGGVFVSDWEDDKVAEYGEGGAFIREFGLGGKEPGQLEQPTSIAVDGKGDVWVGDEKNERVEEFNQGGEYLRSFGSAGSGAGQFGLSYPGGIATDAKGDIWVTDTNDNRVEKWVSANYTTPSTPTYVKAIGAGHLPNPLGVAIDARGDLWALDAVNDALEEFNPSGEFVASYGGPGSGNGQFSAPLPLAINSGHLWVGDVWNYRIQEFNESGAWLSKFGSAGTGAGQMKFLLGVAVDSNHHVWVSDLEDNRVQEFSEAGALIGAVGSLGTGAGQFTGASGIAVGPGNKIFVADYGDGRIEEFSETGGFLRQFGGATNEIGHLLEPMGIYVDSAEHVWVVDRGHNRVVEFNGKGEYLGQFGVAGAGAGAFNTPEYITGDPSGHLFVSDALNTRIDEWSVPTTHSQISTEITVDGKRVEATETSCATESCSATKEWTLQSSSLSPGSHIVVVRATDGLGNTTSKTLNVKVGDTTKPTLTVGGELISAPEGWIEQEEGNYGLTASATDTGFGVTSLLFKVDGSTTASKTQTCAAGGCSASISTTVNAHTLAAGSHPAEVVATDGAGNVATRKWTINVDPEGHISESAATATLEAVDTTSESNAVGPPSADSGYPGMEAGLGVDETAGGQFEATGSNVPLTIGGDLEEGLELKVASESALAVPCEGPEGQTEGDGSEPDEPTKEPSEEGTEEGSGTEGAEAAETCVPLAQLEEMQAKEEEEVTMGLKQPGRQAITITPSTSAGAGSVDGVDGNATVAPNALPDADTVIRPIDDGGLTFEEIRGPSAPEHYAFEMELGPRQELRLLNEHEAAVFYKETGNRGFTISDQLAHDAVGCTVPTHFAVSGEILTLTVEYRGTCQESGQPFVYPIISGTGWEGGWTSTTELIGDKPEEPEPPAEGGTGGGWYAHQLSNGAWVVAESGEPVVGAPTYEHLSIPQGAAGASDSQLRAFRVVTVPWCEKYYSEGDLPAPPAREPGEGSCQLTSSVKIRGFVTALFHYETSPRHAVWWDFGREEDAYCNLDYVAYKWGAWNKACEFSGPNQQVGSEPHIVARNFWRTIGHPPELALVGQTIGYCWPDYIDMYWNGKVSEEDMIENHGEPGFADEGVTCNWRELEQ